MTTCFGVGLTCVGDWWYRKLCFSFVELVEDVVVMAGRQVRFGLF